MHKLLVRKHAKRLGLFLLLSLGFALPDGEAGEVSVLPVQWAAPGEYPVSSAIWDGTTVRIAMARHEDETLMLRLKNGGAVSLSSLAGPQGAKIGAASHRYYLVHQVRVDGVACFDAQAEAKAPMKAPPSSCVVIRIHAPRAAAPGLYKGTLKAGGRSFPVEAEVYSFALPKKTTFLHFTPFWETGSFAKGGREKPLRYFDALWRGRVTPAHGFAGKRTWWGNENKPPTKIDFSKSDWFFRHYFEKAGGALIDIDLYYHYTMLSRTYRSKHPVPAEFKKVTAYLKTCRAYYEKKGWFGSMFVQNPGDEPKMSGRANNRAHCSYANVKLWSKPIKAAGWRCLIAEHPAPQLFDAIDIFNASDTHVSPGDGAELRAMNPPKTLIAYSFGSKHPQDLFNERAMRWLAFMMGLDGVWSWHAYNNGMGKSYKNYRQSLFYGPEHFNAKGPVLTLRVEAWGEGVDDWEYLRLIEKKFGRATALSFASTSANFSGRYGKDFITWRSPDAPTAFTPKTMAEVRALMADLLSAPKENVVNHDFKKSGGIETAKGLVHDGTWFGSYALRPAKTVVLHDGESLKGVKAGGGVTVFLEKGKKTSGDACIKAVFARKGKKPANMALIFNALPDTDFAGAQFLTFDIFLEGGFGLFDVAVEFNDEYGTAYQPQSTLDWSSGEFGRLAGHWSVNGSFPGQWRKVRIPLRQTRNCPAQVSKIKFRMGPGRNGEQNEPEPDKSYTLYVDNVRLHRDGYVKQGTLVSRPMKISGKGQVYVYVLHGAKLPSGTSVNVDTRPAGTDAWRAAKPAGTCRWKAVTPGRRLQYRVTVTSGGQETPRLRGAGIYAE